MTEQEKYLDYLGMLRKPFTKLCRLRFLNPDGSTAFALDNSDKSGAFVQGGSISVNLQNGARRSASVTLGNADGLYDYHVNGVWFGQEVALDEGLILSDGTEYYIQQGVFLVQDPQEVLNPANKTVTYELVDKWANLDGTLYGNLEGIYEVPLGTNIFTPITALLAEDRGNGIPVDRVTPIYTEYYNSLTQELPDGSTASMVLSPYTFRVDGESSTIADIVLGLSGMVNAWVGYDSTGALRIDPSQDDISDEQKPISWQFGTNEATFLGATYTVKNTEVYNDYIIFGESLDDYTQPRARVVNLDPKSDTNVYLIGRKTIRESAAGYYTDTMCEDLAAWKLKRASALQKSVSISCGQLFHIKENELVTIVRGDKTGSPVERHLVMGFTRPLATTGEMTINAVSVQDIVETTTLNENASI